MKHIVSKYSPKCTSSWSLTGARVPALLLLDTESQRRPAEPKAPIGADEGGGGLGPNLECRHSHPAAASRLRIYAPPFLRRKGISCASAGLLCFSASLTRRRRPLTASLAGSSLASIHSVVDCSFEMQRPPFQCSQLS